MKRKPIVIDADAYPEAFRPLLRGAAVYDSSCSQEAQVIFVDRDGGYYLKRAPAGTLCAEADMTAFFHKKGLGAQVLGYVSEEYDWLLTARVPGEDCTWHPYLDQPERLCDLIAERLRMLHELDTAGCPVPDHTARYAALAHKNYREGHYDTSLFPDNWGYTSAEEAFGEIEENGHLLVPEVLLHGDYCLPNIMLNNWQFSGFIDVGNGGVGDRHVDLFWGAWTLSFNLGTDKYRERFLDAYGRDRIEADKLRTVAAFEVFG